jgi:4-hydroxy-3-polyprenylbenzoate decarboxylase
MSYSSLEASLLDLEKNGMLVRISEEVDPYLEMAAIHLRVHEAGGPALLFEKVKGSKFRAASNIFGTLERSKFIFRDSIEKVKRLIAIKQNPASALAHPLQNIPLLSSALHSLPLKNPFQKPVMYEEININDLPLITHWKQDGGAFVTLPQVYSEDVDKPGILHANLGMYRIQLNGNEYIPNQEIGLHYQLHRGIGVHQTKADNANVPFKISCFVGGPPSHSVAAVMPLPEGLSEMTFAGVLGSRRFRYTYQDEFCLSTDADFVICGTVEKGLTKPEGPFGDHLGYYSLQHAFPVMKVHKVYARKNAIWPFTVVGRPPQEDTSFGQLIHEMTGEAIQHELPGVSEVHAVDAAGVHPLLLAVGSERYTPYARTQQPAELLTQANLILGKGQLSLAKYLWIAADESQQLSTKNIEAYLSFILQRVDWRRDVHFYTRTSIDTLDYSGDGLNSGSKMVIAACGSPKRQLETEIPERLRALDGIRDIRSVIPGVLAVQTQSFVSTDEMSQQIMLWEKQIASDDPSIMAFPLWVVCDDAAFLSASLKNFLWVSFTRSNPSHDVHGLFSFTEHKHWGCRGPLVIDARSKPHHAPILEKDPEVEKRIDRFFAPGAVLEKWNA